VVPKIQFFSSHQHLEKKELEMTRGVEDHVEYLAVELALGISQDLREACSSARRRSWWRGIGAVGVDEKSQRVVKLQWQAFSLSNVLV
jgi:hypothetical protein